MLKEYFDKIYCINLDRREDRWKETMKELDKWGMTDEVERYSAVDGSLLENHYNVNNGELGLIETHLKIIKESKDNNYKNVLILEDDIEFTDEIKNINNYFDILPKKWDILWFGANHNKHMGNKIKLIKPGGWGRTSRVYLIWLSPLGKVARIEMNGAASPSDIPFEEFGEYQLRDFRDFADEKGMEIEVEGKFK